MKETLQGYGNFDPEAHRLLTQELLASLPKSGIERNHSFKTGEKLEWSNFGDGGIVVDFLPLP